MDTLEITIERGEGDSDTWESVVFHVNGRDLVELAREVEAPFAQREGHPDIAGGYMGISPAEALHPSLHLLGEPDPALSYAAARLTLLVCDGCGEAGCWPLNVRIEIGSDVVRWTGFEQPHRPDWDLGALGPFTFDRRQYEAALRWPITPP